MSPAPSRTPSEGRKLYPMQKLKKDEPMMTARRLVHGILSMKEKGITDKKIYYAYAIGALDSWGAARIEDCAEELEKAFGEADTLNLLHGAARVRSLRRLASGEGEKEGER